MSILRTASRLVVVIPKRYHSEVGMSLLAFTDPARGSSLFYRLVAYGAVQLLDQVWLNCPVPFISLRRTNGYSPLLAALDQVSCNLMNAIFI